MKKPAGAMKKRPVALPRPPAQVAEVAAVVAENLLRGRRRVFKKPVAELATFINC